MYFNWVIASLTRLWKQRKLRTQYRHCVPAGPEPTGRSTQRPWHLLGLSAANAFTSLGHPGKENTLQSGRFPAKVHN